LRNHHAKGPLHVAVATCLHDEPHLLPQPRLLVDARQVHAQPRRRRVVTRMQQFHPQPQRRVFRTSQCVHRQRRGEDRLGGRLRARGQSHDHRRRAQ
jgi:hypothetical protein